MRLIDADALREGIACHKQYTDQEYETDRQWAFGYNAGIERALFSITYAHTIDAEPVRHGRWVKCQGKSNIWYCSECGEKINYKQNRRTYNIPKVPVWQKNKRCRNCGAKMDAKED